MAEGYRIWPDRISTSYGTQPNVLRESIYMSITNIVSLCYIIRNESKETTNEVDLGNSDGQQRSGRI